MKLLPAALPATDDDGSRPRSWSSPEAEVFEQMDELSFEPSTSSDDVLWWRGVAADPPIFGKGQTKQKTTGRRRTGGVGTAALGSAGCRRCY